LRREQQQILDSWPAAVLVEECEMSHPDRDDTAVTVILSDREIRCHGRLNGVAVAPVVVRMGSRDEARLHYAREVVKLMKGGLRVTNQATAPAARAVSNVVRRQEELAVRRALGNNPLPLASGLAAGGGQTGNGIVLNNERRGVLDPPAVPTPPPATQEAKPLDNYTQPGKRRLL
jgi:hypothetical protein